MTIILSLLVLAAWAYLLTRRGDFYRFGVEAPAPLVSENLPRVAIIVPARNEADMLGQTLPCLLAQDYAGSFRVILVDDGSTDGTGALAHDLSANNPCLTVLTAPPTKEGWTGKLAALEAGIEAAPDMDAYLFTDADIAHPSDSLSNLVARAEERRAGLVSLMVKLRCHSWAERALIPAFVFFFKMLYPFSFSNDPARSTAAGAGGVMYVRAEALRRAGGLAAIKGAWIDDCALAAAVKRTGEKTFIGLTATHESLRPYENLRAVWDMVARTAYTQLRYSPFLLLGTVVGMVLLFLLPPLWMLMGDQLALRLSGAITFFMMLYAYAPAIRFYGLPAYRAASLPIAAALYTAMTVDSAWRHHRGGNVWKGRSLQFKNSTQDSSATQETPSGKNANTENFPVGSFLIRPSLRPSIHALYRFARASDDIADNPALPPEEKIARLTRFSEILDGATDPEYPAAENLRDDLKRTGLTAQHAKDLLRAFTQDARKNRYENWAELLDYCRYSAAPVGRHVLSLHGIGESTWPANDALCSALQIINHLQDMKADYIEMDRIYIPQDALVPNGIAHADLAGTHLTPALRRIIDGLLDQMEPLLAEGRGLPAQLPDFRLRLEVAIISQLADDLTALLRRKDPLKDRCKLTPLGWACAIMRGTLLAFRSCPTSEEMAKRSGAKGAAA